MPPTKNPKMKVYPNIERRFRIGASKKKKEYLLQVCPGDGFRFVCTRCCHTPAPVPIPVANTL